MKDLDAAYKNFFRGIKQKKKVGYPKYKSKKNNRQSYRVPNGCNIIRVYDNKINLPKLSCGAKYDGTKDLSIRKWICPECGIEHDRDINAAINILNEGLRLLDR